MKKLTIQNREASMPNLKKSTLYSMITLVLLSGCTQVVTAPIEIVGSVASATIDVADATVDAVSDSDEEEKEN